RHVIDRIGEWNPELGSLQGTVRTGEDHEFGLRMLDAGFVGVYEPEASVRHRVAPERLRLSYFQRWFHANGAVGAALEYTHPSTRHYLLNVPRHLWRQFVHDVLETLGRVLAFNARRAIAAWMRVAWFAGYLRGRWQRRPACVEAGAAPARVARS